MWIRIGDQPGEIQPDVVNNLVDALAEFIFDTAEDFKFDPYVSGIRNAPAPEWADNDQ